MRIRLLCTAGSGLGLLTLASYLALWSKHPDRSDASPDAPPDTIQLTGVVRDFREKTVPGGHPDMERMPSHGGGHYAGNIATTLGEDGKPVFTGQGHRVDQPWRDASNRPICYSVFDSSLGDQAGEWGPESTGAITSAASYNTWFRDVPGMNLSAPLSVTLVRQADGSYVFDDRLDPLYGDRAGFFPIDNMLFGNSPGNPDHNYHFTYELHTQFTFDADANQVFRFVGDDDVWVFINGKLVIDLGGIHVAYEEVIELNRLGLADDQAYSLDFFFAERHRTQSNFRIQTNLVLESVAPSPSITSGYD
jgi:fibro-slime domain-containing protein